MTNKQHAELFDLLHLLQEYICTCDCVINNEAEDCTCDDVQEVQNTINILSEL